MRTQKALLLKEKPPPNAPPEMFDPEFFPTPRAVISQMLSKVDHDARYFLEPSAGRGDIAEYILRQNLHRHRTVIECIESSPDLCAILASKNLPVIGHDWLTYEGVSYYDAIIMNPPFGAGATHLLRAWEFIHDGEIVCLLNSETLTNPHTTERRRLATIIEKHGEVEHLGSCFKKAARATTVDASMVYLKKTAEDDRPELWETGTEERPIDNLLEDPNLPAVLDVLENKQRFYDEANRHMILAFQHARKAEAFLGANGIYSSNYSEILAQAMKSNLSHTRAEFMRKHRKDAWLSVFEMMQFRLWLDKKQTDDLIRDVSTNAVFPFTVENIKGTLENVLLQRRKLFEQSVWNVFQSLTSYYKGNTNHTEGWKTNQAFTVNQRLVFPYGVSYDHKYGGFSLWRSSMSAINFYDDLDRVLAVLDSLTLDKVFTIGQALEMQFREDRHTKRLIESKYFEIRYFKKGTVHLKWKREDLREKFCLTAAAGRKWIGDAR